MPAKRAHVDPARSAYRRHEDAPRVTMAGPADDAVADAVRRALRREEPRPGDEAALGRVVHALVSTA